MRTDSKILLDEITGNRYKTESCLMVDIATIREAYHERRMPNIGFIRRQYNIAGGPTKVERNHALEILMQTNIIDRTIKQYI